MSFEPREYLRHILTEADFLIGRSAGLTLESFERDDTLRRAFARSLEVIGEAAKKLTDEYRAMHPQVESRAMTGMRDRLLHAYFGVDDDLVWDVVVNKIPALRRQIAEILDAGERVHVLRHDHLPRAPESRPLELVGRTAGHALAPLASLPFHVR